jgi:hypothetical protein
MARPEIYVSMDIEADGPIPGPNSMLSFGAACFAENGTLVGTIDRNLDLLEGAQGDPDTMAWWGTQPEAWAACRKDPEPPEVAMNDLLDYLTELGDAHNANLVFVGYPATYDFMFVYWYLIKFAGRSPFSFSGLDIKTYACAVLKKNYKACAKRGMPKRWFKGNRKHTHEALDDAIGQGQLFLKMRAENLA